jgi:hypothetical protein
MIIKADSTLQRDSEILKELETSNIFNGEIYHVTKEELKVELPKPVAARDPPSFNLDAYRHNRAVNHVVKPHVSAAPRA